MQCPTSGQRQRQSGSLHIQTLWLPWLLTNQPTAVLLAITVILPLPEAQTVGTITDRSL